MTRRELWLKIYLALRQAGMSHNNAMRETNGDVCFVFEALMAQSLESIEVAKDG